MVTWFCLRPSTHCIESQGANHTSKEVAPDFGPPCLSSFPSWITFYCVNSSWPPFLQPATGLGLSITTPVGPIPRLSGAAHVVNCSRSSRGSLGMCSSLMRLVHTTGLWPQPSLILFNWGRLLSLQCDNLRRCRWLCSFHKAVCHSHSLQCRTNESSHTSPSTMKK